MGAGQVRLRLHRRRRAAEAAIRVLVPAPPELDARRPHRGPHHPLCRGVGRPMTAARTETPSVLAGVGRDVAWVYLHVVVSVVVDTTVAGLAVRRLGPSAFGYVAAALTIAGLVAVVDVGLNVAVIRATARVRSAPSDDARRAAVLDVRSAHSAYVALGGGTAVLSVAAAVVLGRVAPAAATAAAVAPGMLLLGTAVAMGFATSAMSGVAIGCRRFRSFAGGSVAGALVNLVTCLVLLSRC